MQCKVHIQSNQARGLESDFASFSIKWDPSVLDYEHPENNGESDWAIDPNENFQFNPNFDEFGDYVNRSLSILDILDDTPPISPIYKLMVNKHVFQHTPVDYEKLRPFFGWVNSDIVKQTIDQTTEWGVALDSFPVKRHLKSRSPALNIPRRHEPVATDTIFQIHLQSTVASNKHKSLRGETH